MPVILLETDPFVEAMDGSSEDLAFKEANVRRPLEGMLQKQTRHAFLSIYRMDGSEFKYVSLIDSSAPKAHQDTGYSDATHNFILQTVAQSHQEKVQIVETFGPFYAFFYGQKPTVLQCQGLLLNSADFNWKNEWLRNYDRYLRGTRCVEFKARVYLGFDDVLIQGFILGTSLNYSSDNPLFCPFSFSLLVTAYKDLSEGSDDYVRYAEGARARQGSHLGKDQEQFSEYVTGISEVPYWYIDMATGELKSDSNTSSKVPWSSPSDSRSAHWVGDGSSGKLWKGPGEALTFIDTDLAVQQTDGADKLTAQIQRRKSPDAFPLASRDSNSSGLATALGEGVANCACVIDDHPTVG
tara:strand:- start:154 stop:1212 length:1059 start_codon:yes stop_codon:yes gene_type:complete